MYRDELEAALSRADAAEARVRTLEEKLAAGEAQIGSLKAELEAARAELATLRKQLGKKAAKVERPPARVQLSPRAPSSRRNALLTALGIGGAAALIAGLLIGERACARHHVRSGPGELYAAHIVEAADGSPRLIVVSKALHDHDGVGGSIWRVDLVDLTTGTRVRRKVWGGERKGTPNLLPAAPGRFWCDLYPHTVDSNHIVELCDSGTLEVIVDEAALVAANPALRGGLQTGPEVDLGSGAILFTTKQGDNLQVNAADLHGQPFHPGKDVVCIDSSLGDGRMLRATFEAVRWSVPAPAHRLHPGTSCASLDVKGAVGRAQWDHFRGLPRLEGLGQSQHGTTPSLDLDSTRSLAFEPVQGGPRVGLHLRRGYGQTNQPVGDATFLGPEFLAGYGDGWALRPPGEAAVVVHRDSLDRNAGRLRLSRVALADGAVAWTVDEPPGEVLMATTAGERVIVAIRRFGDQASVVLGIESAGGTVKWRYQM